MKEQLDEIDRKLSLLKEKVDGDRSRKERRATFTFNVETEMEEDGRWIAEVKELPGVLVYGKTQHGAIAKAISLAAKVLSLEHYS